jgi:hypothetical protein
LRICFHDPDTFPAAPIRGTHAVRQESWTGSRAH